MFDYDKFEALIDSTGITKKFIADALDRKPSIFSSWRTGKSKPSDEQLAIVAQILHTTPAYLRGETDEKEPATPKSDGLVQEPLLKWADKDIRLLMWFRSLPPEKQRAILISQDAPEEIL